MKAKNELAQHLGEDPLPLRKAKITAEAAAKKLDKANKTAQEAKSAAEAAAATAEKDRVSAEEAVQEGQRQVEAAEKFLEEQKAKGTGKTEGTFWWLDRELAERKKYMPKTGNAKLLF